MNERVLYPSTGIKDVSLLQQEDRTSTAVGADDQAEAANDCRQLTYFELARLMERVSRRFSGLVRAELTKLRVDDIGPAQAMVLLAIGDAELSVAELLDRGHYVGSNVSYYLKQLADGDYIDRVASQRDKRSARIKLTEKGRLLRANLRDAAMAYERALNRGHQDRQNLETAFQTLHQLELVWGSASRYDM